MAVIRKRESAKRDLTAQWVWYADQAGIEIADQFRAVEQTLLSLASFPEMGQRVMSAVPELAGLRRFPVGDGFESQMLYYFPLSSGVDLLRVIHGRRHWERELTKTRNDE